MLIAFLTTFVFYLPTESKVPLPLPFRMATGASDQGKIPFSLSIQVTLTVFYLVLIDLIPPTSLVIPLFGPTLPTFLCRL